MSDEEEDYMSSAFLQEAEEFESKRQETYSERRKRQLREHEKKSYIKPKAELEAEQREKGLKQSVANQDNKGMKMLMKMGFKKGSGLGKDGITEPIQVEMKSDRMGLGMKRKQEQEEEEEFNKRKREQVDPDDYRVMMAQRSKENQLSRYLPAAVSVCEKLDAEKEITSNVLWVLKPVHLEGDEEEIKAQELEIQEKESLYPEEEVRQLKELPLTEKLDKVVDYLRTKHLYCFWCSAKYENEEDLEANCPGPSEEDH